MKQKKKARKLREQAAQQQPQSRPVSTWMYFSAILVLAFLIRADTILTGNYRYHVLRGFETQALADSLVKTGTFANPYRFPTGPTAHLTPMFPLYLSGLMCVSGSETTYEMAKEVLSALAASLHYALLPFLAVALGLRRSVGVLAGFLSIGIFLWLPANIQPLEILGSWENTYTALAIVGFTIFAAKTLRQAQFSIRDAVIWGILWGLFLLLLPTMSLVYPVWLFVMWLLSERAVRPRFLKFAGISIALTLLTMSPWMIRNLKVLGSPVWTRDDFGMELYASNNDCASPTFVEIQASGCHARMNPNASPEEAAEIRRVGEIAYNRERMAIALDWIRVHPSRFVQLTVGRFWSFWFVDLGPGSASYPVWIVTLLGFAGAVACWRTNRLAGGLLGALLVFYPAAYYLAEFVVRYRYPILWVSTMLASYALVRGWQWMTDRNPTT